MAVMGTFICGSMALVDVPAAWKAGGRGVEFVWSCMRPLPGLISWGLMLRSRLLDPVVVVLFQDCKEHYKMETRHIGQRSLLRGLTCSIVGAYQAENPAPAPEEVLAVCRAGGSQHEI
jgi:hypothetical protein